ncbi:hypothetical protein DFH08DRAFT_813712 [Mycena albidolilacea]|uniref:Rho termination factor-like N-terminal domain-containing protein n=1 Tax=Mycena albidolilacea TaxID=1033008 RepID=A0AAD7EKM7_9AGAR|nr:hypothetical protein DFH08DRAFT_813712 [Mycena albidolilacea]
MPVSPNDSLQLSECPLEKKLVSELLDIAKAMNINTAKLHKPDILKAIKVHIQTHLGLADDPHLLPLVGHCTVPKVLGKTSAGKATEEEMESSKSKEPATGTNRALFEHKVKTNPPAQYKMLLLGGPKGDEIAEPVDTEDAVFRPKYDDSSVWAARLDRSGEYVDYISEDLASLYMMLGINMYNLAVLAPPPLFSIPHMVLCSSCLSCVFCPPADLNITPTLQRCKKPHSVWLLDKALAWVEADLIIAHCASGQADYYPDCITYRDNDNHQLQRLETISQYIQMLNHSIWAHRQIAVLQENALN